MNPFPGVSNGEDALAWGREEVIVAMTAMRLRQMGFDEYVWIRAKGNGSKAGFLDDIYDADDDGFLSQ